MIAAVQIAATGVRKPGCTRFSAFDAGSPPSRAKAKIIREAEVTVASPQMSWQTNMRTSRTCFSATGSTASSVKKKTPQPLAAALSMSGIASTKALSISQPNSAE